MDQPKIERMLRLMKMMSGNINYSVEELSEKLEMSDRTIPDVSFHTIPHIIPGSLGGNETGFDVCDE